MSPESRNRLAIRGAAEANSVNGIPVQFRGREIRVILAPINIGFDLDVGGLKQSGQFRCRFLASDLDSPPRRTDTVLYNGRTYKISEVTEQATTPGEHVVTLTPGSAQ